MIKNALRYPILLLSLLISTLPTLSAQSTPATNQVKTTSKDSSIFETLLREDLLSLHIKTNMKQLIKEKEEEKKQEAELSYLNKAGAKVVQAIKVRTRGNMRKNICSVPPIKIYFPKDTLEKAGFKRKFNDYKLVFSCQSSSIYENYILKEYLIYKLYNLFTENSYRVQLIHLTIEDTAEKHKTVESYGFIIENDDLLAARLNGELINPKILSPKSITPESYDQMAVFQFMVGNTDWFMYNKHNLKILKQPVVKYIAVIPYDFDYAGIINTNYATPHEKLPIEYVRERFFLGMCRDKGTYEPILQKFRDKKEAVLATCSNLQYLDEKAKKNAINYLEDFFEILDNPKKIRQKIVQHCDQHVKIE